MALGFKAGVKNVDPSELMLFDSGDKTKYLSLWTSDPSSFAVYQSSGVRTAVLNTTKLYKPNWKKLHINCWHRNEYNRSDNGGYIELIDENGARILLLTSWVNNVSGATINSDFNISSVTKPFRIRFVVYCSNETWDDSRCYVYNVKLLKK